MTRTWFHASQLRNAGRSLFAAAGLSALMGLCLSLPVHAQAEAQAEDSGQTEPLSRFEVRMSDYATMSTIASRFSIEGGHDDVVYVYVPWSQHHDLWALAPDAELVEEDVDAWMRNLSEADKVGYRSYEEYGELFKELEAKYPKLVRVENLDFMKTRNGKHIHVLRVTKNVQKDNAKRPNVVITGSTHGDEWSSTAIPMNIMLTMLERYGEDERVTKIFDRVNTYWVPAVSPDSYHRSRNVHGVDPNRVYPYPNRDKPPKIESAQNFIKWYDTLKPKGVIDFHAVHGSVLWPWGCSRKPIPDEDFKVYNTLAKKMVEKTGYQQGQVTKILYDAPGVSIDAWYHLYGAIAYTIEVGGRGKKPAESSLDKLIEDNREHVYTFFEHFIVGEPEEDDEDESEDDDDKDDGKGSDKDKDDDKGDGDKDKDDGDKDKDDGDKDKDDGKGDDDKDKDDKDDGKGDDKDKDDDAGDKDKDKDDDAGDKGSEKPEEGGDEGKDKGGCQVSGGSAPLWLLGGLVLPWLSRKKRRA